MNRTYQGCVSKVEIPDGKGEWKKLDAGESALLVAPKPSKGEGSTTNCFRTG